MKKMFVLWTFLLTGILGNAQGIQFWKGNFDDAVQEAKRQNKLIFVDFYTVWCGPCKSLAKNVFPQEEVGRYFNEKFICCQLDAEKEGRELARKYEVSAYPTLLFINADGDVVARMTGAVSAEDLIAGGKNALLEKDNPNNMVNLRKRYEAGERDEAFLKSYLEKRTANDMDPGEVVEEYLKVQKTIPENSSKMMEFLMNNDDFLVLGGEAERIFQKNEKEYMDIATRLEEKKLSQLRTKMMNLTQKRALANKDVPMYELFLDRWVKLPEKPYYQDYNDLYLELLLLKNDQKAYKELACTYLDSIVDSRTLKDIREGDQKRYDEYCKNNPARGLLADLIKDSYRDVDAKLQTNAILKVGGQLLKNAKRKDFKRFPKWIEHGKQLLTDDYRMTNFESTVLYHQGKKEKAIALKRKALDMLAPKDKTYPIVKQELEKMEKGEF